MQQQQQQLQKKHQQRHRVTGCGMGETVHHQIVYLVTEFLFSSEAHRFVEHLLHIFIVRGMNSSKAPPAG